METGGTKSSIGEKASVSSSSVASIKEFVPSSSAFYQSSDIGLPDGDDILGMSTGAKPFNNAQDLASQAAEMFNSMRPFQPSSTSTNPPTTSLPSTFIPSASGRGEFGNITTATGGNIYQRHSATPAAPGRFSTFPTPSGGRFPSTTPAHHPTARGRGRGRGGGRGPTNPSGPGSNRPFIAAYALTPGRMQLAGRFISETLKHDMDHKRYITTTQLDDETLRESGLPPIIQQYHTLCPLEDPGVAIEHMSASLGVYSFIFKGIHSGDGAAYALRRLDGRQIIPTAELVASAEGAVKKWAVVANHPNVVGLREVFVSDEVEAIPSLFFSYDFYPGVYTLEQAHIAPIETGQGLSRIPATEEQLWSYLVQLTSALRAIHTAGMSVGPAALSPSKIIVSAPARVRLAAVGISDALMESPSQQQQRQQDITRKQQEDLASLGSLILVLACSARNAPLALDTLAEHYSRDLCHVVSGLLASRDTGGGFAGGWRSLVSALGDRVFAELETSQTSVDTVSTELEKEYDNGRIARLLIKLCMVNERPELFGDERWSETGDRYLLKLFRDFVFHQVDADGAPVVEWGSVIEALNKMDAGVEERVMLLSRDEASMLVVSYADIKRCLMSAYSELKTASHRHRQQHSSSGVGHAMYQQQ